MFEDDFPFPRWDMLIPWKVFVSKRSCPETRDPFCCHEEIQTDFHCSLRYSQSFSKKKNIMSSLEIRMVSVENETPKARRISSFLHGKKGSIERFRLGFLKLLT